MSTYYEKNKEKIRERSKIYYQNNKHKINRRCASYTRNYLQNNPIKALLKNTKLSARMRNIEHLIAEKDIIIPTHCPYLNIPIVFNRGLGKTNNSLSVDRIDNTKGYIPGNVQVISLQANRMKNNATTEELITFAQNVLNIFNKGEA